MNRPQGEKLTRRRVALIIQVRSGQITATEAARRLGESRKSWYKWEHRALAGMLEALNSGPPGRPSQPGDPQKEALQREVDRLRRENLLLRQSLELKEMLRTPVGEPRTRKKKAR